MVLDQPVQSDAAARRGTQSRWNPRQMVTFGLASKPLATFAEDRKKPAIRVSYWEALFPVWSLPDQSGRAENTGEAFVNEKLK